MSTFDMIFKLFGKAKSTRSKQAHSARQKLNRRMTLESLEGRELNAVDVSLNSEGLLRITGDAEHNYADVMLEGDKIAVYTIRNRLDQVPDEAIVPTFDPAAVKQIFIDGLAGDDYFINRTDLPAVMYGGEGQDYLLAGTGRNQLYGEAGLDEIGQYGVERQAPRIQSTLRGPQDQSPLAVYYRQLPDAATVLGSATNGGQEYVSPNGQAKMRTYENGVIVWTAGNGSVHVVGNMLKKWESLGGFNNPIVGNPKSPEEFFSNRLANPPKDTMQVFEHGWLVYRPSVGDQTFEIHGEIFKRWTAPVTDAKNSTKMDLGLPRSDEMPTSDGKGQVSKFDRGSIVWNRATNTTSIFKPIGIKLVNPGTALNNKLLFLTSVAPARLGGLSMSTTTSDLYTKLGREKGALGPQVAGEKLINSKLVFVTQFKFGAIYRTMTSTFEVHGAIYEKYLQMGGPAGELGLPRTNETAVGDAAGGRFNTFEYGAIFWTPARGAFEVHGAIWKTWTNLGGTRSSLGYPTSDERDVSVNSRFVISNFQNGAIVYSPDTDCIVLQGSMWNQWKAYGAEKGFLGAPTSSVQSLSLPGLGTVQSMQFEGGTLRMRGTAVLNLDFNFSQMKFALKQLSTDGTRVTQAKLNLMRGFLNPPNTMPDYVSNLLNKVVNGDQGNRTYRQATLGNLFTNAPNSHLESLTDKWFGGGERPVARNPQGTVFTHSYADGVLYGLNGPQLIDIQQGGLNTCYLLGPLASIAGTNPQAIRDMIIDNGDDTFTIRFFNGNKAEYVTVDRFLPTDMSGRMIYSLRGRQAALSESEAFNSPVWSALIEKAYAIAAYSGLIPGQMQSSELTYGGEGMNAGIEGGASTESVKHLLGREVMQYQQLYVFDSVGDQNVVNLKKSKERFLSLKSQIIEAANPLSRAGNQHMLLWTGDSSTSDKLGGPHCYVVYSANNDELLLFQLYGGGGGAFRISWEEAAGNFQSWEII